MIPLLLLLLLASAPAASQAVGIFDPLNFLGIDDQEEPDLYRQIYRRYQGRLFATVYQVRPKANGRLLTLEWNPLSERWSPVNTYDLGDAVEAQGIAYKDQESEFFLPGSPYAIANIARQLYILDLYATPQFIAINVPPTPIRKIPLGGFALATALSPDGKTLYALRAAEGVLPIRLSLFDTATERITTTFNLTAGSLSQANQLALSPDGRTLYIAIENSLAPATSNILPFDTLTQKTGTPIPAPSAALPFRGVWVSPDNNLLYAATPTTVEIFDTATATPVSSIRLSTVNALVFAADSTKAYVAAESRRIYEIDVATSRLGRSVTFDSTLFSNLVLTPGGERLLGWDANSSTIRQILTRPMQALDPINPAINASGFLTVFH